MAELAAAAGVSWASFYRAFESREALLAALDLARFLAQRGRFGEARALCDEYDELADKRGWKVFRPEIAEIRRLIAARQPAT